MGCSSGREEALSVQNGLAKKVKNILQLETHSWTRDRSRTTSRLNWISKAYRVNQNMWISRWWRWSWAKRKGTQTKCTVDGGRRLHLQTLIPATLQSDSLWVFSDEVESDRDLTWKHGFLPLLSKKQAANCVWQIESILPCPLPSLCKISFLAFFSLSWTLKSPICCCMPCKHKRKEVTFIGPEFICIPALPSPHVGFYELTQAKH